MSREIKFRAWGKFSSTSEEMNYFDLSMGNWCKRSTEMQVMQYTGFINDNNDPLW